MKRLIAVAVFLVGSGVVGLVQPLMAFDQVVVVHHHRRHHHHHAVVVVRP
ncbi:MAG: hypothetical protein ABSB67_02205 [Bryobacteraceae bacterium]